MLLLLRLLCCHALFILALRTINARWQSSTQGSSVSAQRLGAPLQPGGISLPKNQAAPHYRASLFGFMAQRKAGASRQALAPSE